MTHIWGVSTTIVERYLMVDTQFLIGVTMDGDC